MPGTVVRPITRVCGHIVFVPFHVVLCFVAATHPNLPLVVVGAAISLNIISGNLVNHLHVKYVYDV